MVYLHIQINNLPFRLALLGVARCSRVRECVDAPSVFSFTLDLSEITKPFKGHLVKSSLNFKY